MAKHSSGGSTRYLPHAARTELGRTAKDMEAAKSQPQAWEKVQNKEKFEKDLASEKARLEALTPPDITSDAQRDALVSRSKMLQEALVKGNSKIPAMPSEYDMWKTPAGAVGRHRAWEQGWTSHALAPDGTPVRVDPSQPDQPQAAIWEYKDIQRTLGKDSEEMDLEVASIEKIRPVHSKASLIDAPSVTYAQNSAMSYAEYVKQFPDFVPEANIAFMYAPMFGVLNGVVMRTAAHPLCVAGTVKPGPCLAPEPKAPAEPCKATTSRGSRCKRDATSNGYCDLPQHLAQGASAAA